MKACIAFLAALLCLFGLAACKAPAQTESTAEETTAAATESSPAEWVPEYAVSYANWTGDHGIYIRALNRDTMMISSARHLPIYKFDTQKALDRFKADFGNALTMEHGYDEIPAFSEVTAACDEAFFAENTLILVYVSANSGSYRYGIRSVFCDGGTLSVHVEKLNDPEAVTDDMAGWFLTFALPNDVAENCTAFDAVLN